ncbi:hypothetical protein Misp01_66520 [Microtetraspora sp. NBRC 13810]|nr:hypothetical protein Misp01_66520 [Microtetraspora sp. NBRC 13810]
MPEGPLRGDVLRRLHDPITMVLVATALAAVINLATINLATSTVQVRQPWWPRIAPWC